MVLRIRGEEFFDYHEFENTTMESKVLGI